jgi:ribosome maturation factor RimP
MVVKRSAPTRRASLLSEREAQVQPSSEPSALADAFERIVHGLPHQREFSGIEIVATRAKRNRDGMALGVMVDKLEKSAGVDIATCERVAARINVALEAFSEPYTLEVESAGLNRPLVKPSDYDRFIGENVRVVSTLAIRNAKTHRGKLAGVRGTNVILQTPAGELPIPLEVVKSANIEFDIRADLQRAKRTKNEQKDSL